MNEILHLKGKLHHSPNNVKPGSPKLPPGKKLSSNHLKSLSEQLKRILTYWKSNTVINGALVSVHYKTIIAKSNRLKILLSEKGLSPTESIRGAKFVPITTSSGKHSQKHVFTHFISINSLEKSIERLDMASIILDEDFNGIITSDETEILGKKPSGEFHKMKKNNFLSTLVDSYYVEKFEIDRATEEITEESIITIYQTGIDTKTLLSKFDIHIIDERIIDETTLRLTPDEAKLLYNHASYLIAMSVTDFSQIDRNNLVDTIDNTNNDIDSIIPHPTNEPIIGVIDTMFNENVYFHEWVEFKNLLDPNIPLSPVDYQHGTWISNIIVDGPSANPHLDDGCGRFKVRHFGVATHSGFSSFQVLKMIKNIVTSNRDIKVWNLSLGSILEIKQNFISPEAAELDRIQNQYDVIFVVAGTNIPNNSTQSPMKIGSPADSLNSIVVNSVDFSDTPASYTRTGPVLSFFHKPDISYYGGDGISSSSKIAVCGDNTGASYVKGTSFAAPWISRKLAFLIHKIGLTREVAKALLIDVAAGWNRKDDISHKVGYGVVPIHINEILKTPDDEIRFILTGEAEEYETFTYNLPVPIVDNTHPFYARATLAYFPQCNRNQGVDYTSTEMDIHFGRVNPNKTKPKINSINNNLQSEEELHSLYEEDARKLYRKWDNIKHISEEIKSKKIPRKAYEYGLWGLKIKTKERFRKRDTPLRFGVVITLKEMYGVNRINDFIKMCMARNWLVHKIDIDNQLDIYAKSEEEIVFE